MRVLLLRIKEFYVDFKKQLIVYQSISSHIRHVKQNGIKGWHHLLIIQKRKNKWIIEQSTSAQECIGLYDAWIIFAAQQSIEVDQ